MTSAEDTDPAPQSLSAADVDRIERELGVSLPGDYRKALLGARPAGVDQTSMLDSADLIIGFTTDYRNGFAGLPRWPKQYVYIGDEADACPYALDCVTGRIIKLDKGNPDTKPISEFASLSAFYGHFVPSKTSASASKPRWREMLDDAMPWILAFTVFFVILPAIAISLKALFIGL